jgi:hypothetical protein
MDHGGPWYVAQPGGERIDRGQWNNALMQSTNSANKRWAEWEFYCQQVGPAFRINRAKVDSLWNTAVANTGGHGTVHALANKPVQEHWRTSGFTDANRVFIDTIWGNVASGDEIYRMAWTDSTPGSPCYGGSKVEVQTVATRWLECCMTPVTAKPYLTLVPPESNHSYPFYALPGVEGLIYLAAELMSVNMGTTIELEAVGLIYGGVNDTRNTWAPPHNTHRTGTDVDFDIPGPDNQRAFNQMIRIGQRGIFRRCQIDNRNHVHCFARLY